MTSETGNDPDLRLDGRAAIVTGGSKGIGLATARRLALAGASVCVVARGREQLDAAVAELREIDERCFGVSGPLEQGATLREAVERSMAEFGSIDVVVNNAATTEPRGPVVDVPMDDFDHAVRLNLAAPLELTQLAWRAWMREHGGTVLNIASVGGMRPRRGFGAYGATKAALIYLTQILALELAPTVRVNGISPGLVRTDLGMNSTTRTHQASARDRPLGRLGEPDDIARAALFLCSPASAWTTGEVLVVDGGAYIAS